MIRRKVGVQRKSRKSPLNIQSDVDMRERLGLGGTVGVDDANIPRQLLGIEQAPVRSELHGGDAIRLGDAFSFHLKGVALPAA